jgi:hypothetical protein
MAPASGKVKSLFCCLLFDLELVPNNEQLFFVRNLVAGSSRRNGRKSNAAEAGGNISGRPAKDRQEVLEHRGF